MSILKYLSTLLLTIITLVTNAQEGFRLTGIAPDSLEGSMIYIGTTDYADSKYEWRDSTRITQGRFIFTGRLPQTAMLTSLVIKKPKFGMYQFLLENRDISITIYSSARNTIDSCTFTNAPVQEQYMQLKKKQKPANDLIIRQYKKMDTAMAKADEAGKQKMNDELITLFWKEKQVTVQYIKENPDNYLSLYQLSYFIAGGAMKYPDSLNNLLKGLSKNLQQQPEALILQKRIQQAKAVAVGQPAQWTTLPTDQNKPLALADYKGKYVLLDFWASWCIPCIQNLPDVKELYSEYQKENFDIIGVSLDDNKTKWIEAIKKHNLPWTQASDLKGWKNAVALLYDIRSIPQYILVGPDAKIIASSDDIGQIKQQLEKTLKQTATLKQ
ncbi:MAG: AhpC/TSA family protein [Niastella sp.]|nr:AhpC/TSA family protein [Niastella sp.]